MPYKIMKKLIADGTKPKEELLNMADVYFAVGRLTQEEYFEIAKQINEMEDSAE